MYKNNFLDKIGYPSNQSMSSFVFGNKDDKRNKKWRKQRKRWGRWDSRIVYNLDTFLLESLYTWLRIYDIKTNGIVNLDDTEFNIGGKNLTQKECIKRMLDDLEYALLNLDNSKDFGNVKVKVKDCFYILGECLFTLWW